MLGIVRAWGDCTLPVAKTSVRDVLRRAILGIALSVVSNSGKAWSSIFFDR